MWRYLKLYPRFVAQNFQAKVEYKLDFWLGVSGSLMIQITGLAFIWVIFSRIPDLNGWSFYQVTFIYGLAAIPKALTEFFFDGIWYLVNLIYLGEMDRLMTRPLNPLFQLIAERIEPHGLGHLIVGGAILVVSSQQLAIQWNAARLLYLLLAAVCGTLIYFGINLLSACIAFWTISTGPWMLVFYNLSEFAKYPITIYSKFIQAVITWLLPFAFTSFFPATYLLGDGRWRTYAALLPLVTAILLGLAYRVWLLGINNYQSAGS